MEIPNINRAALHGTGASQSHVPEFLDKIDLIINTLNPIVGDPGEFNNFINFNAGLAILGAILGDAPGSIAWDPIKGNLLVRGKYPGNIWNAGKETFVDVCNQTGDTLEDGTVVYINGFNEASDCHTVVKAKADSLDNAKLLGVVTTTMTHGSMGLVTKFGRVNEIDTSGEAAGAPIYLSDTEEGGWTTTKPPVAFRIGYIGCVGPSGCILVDIQEQQPSIFGSFYSAVNQFFADGVTSKVVPLEEEYEVKGLGHSKTVNPEEITFLSSGVYVITGNFQLNRTAGGASPEDVKAWLQKSIDDGVTWVNVPWTTISQASTDQGDPARLSANVGAPFDRNDRIRVRARATSSDIFLEAINSEGDGEHEAPGQASVMFSVYRLGD